MLIEIVSDLSREFELTPEPFAGFPQDVNRANLHFEFGMQTSPAISIDESREIAEIGIPNMLF